MSSTQAPVILSFSWRAVSMCQTTVAHTSSRPIPKHHWRASRNFYIYYFMRNVNCCVLVPPTCAVNSPPARRHVNGSWDSHSPPEQFRSPGSSSSWHIVSPGQRVPVVSPVDQAESHDALDLVDIYSTPLPDQKPTDIKFESPTTINIKTPSSAIKLPRPQFHSPTDESKRRLLGATENQATVAMATGSSRSSVLLPPEDDFNGLSPVKDEPTATSLQ